MWQWMCGWVEDDYGCDGGEQMKRERGKWVERGSGGNEGINARPNFGLSGSG